MPGARRGRPEDKVMSGRELWTREGTETLIRKLESDPGLDEESRKRFIDSVRSGAVDRGIVSGLINNKPVQSIENIIEPKPKGEEMTTNKAVTNNETASSTTDQKIDFDSYQAFTNTVALYPHEVGVSYTITGLCGETAEVAGKLQLIIARTLLTNEGLAGDEGRKNMCYLNDLLKSIAKLGADAEKFKKAVRKGEKKLSPIKSISASEKEELIKELGDVLWYAAQLAEVMDVKLSDVAAKNVEKLTSRKARGVLHGNGDNR